MLGLLVLDARTLLPKTVLFSRWLPVLPFYLSSCCYILRTAFSAFCTYMASENRACPMMFTIEGTPPSCFGRLDTEAYVTHRRKSTSPFYHLPDGGAAFQATGAPPAVDHPVIFPARSILSTLDLSRSRLFTLFKLNPRRAALSRVALPLQVEKGSPLSSSLYRGWLFVFCAAALYQPSAAAFSTVGLVRTVLRGCAGASFACPGTKMAARRLK